MPSIEERPLRRGGEVIGTRYVVRVRDPDPKPGKAGYTSATFATRQEATRFIRDIEDESVAFALVEYRRGKEAATELTLDEWAEIHFDTLTEAAAGTIRRYRRIYRDTWAPHLGRMQLSRIDRANVAAALKQVTGSDKTVKNKWAVLTHMFKVAVQDGKLERTPTLGVKTPRRTEHETEERRYLTHAEFFAVLNATPDYWQPLVMMLAGTGMRWGEAAALTVGDVDLENRRVRVTKAVKQDPEHPTRTIVGPTKTRKSRRTITLPNEVAGFLPPLIAGRRRSERLFLPPNGGELRHRTFYRDIWIKKSCAKSGIAEPFPRLHDLRHSHVAWLIAANRPLPVIQARLGHEKITTTIDTYGHLLPDLQRDAADAADRVFGGDPKELDQ